MQIYFKQVVAAAVVLTSYASLSMAQSCTNAQDINPGDFSALISDVANDAFNPPLANPFALNAESSQSFTLGTAFFCVQNRFIFENTHVFLSTVSGAAQQIFNNCGGGQQGGSNIIQGDSGLNLTFFVTRTGTESC